MRHQLSTAARSHVLRRKTMCIGLTIVLPLMAGCGKTAQRDAIGRLRAQGAIVQVNADGDAFWIDLHEATISATTFDSLRETPHVKSLFLAGSKLADHDIEKLECAGDLEALDLSYTPITEVGLSLLRKFTHLTQLSLNGVRINDRAIDELRALHLKGLSVMQSALDAKSVDRLQTALPGCLIVH